MLGALIGFMNATTEPVFSSGWWTSSGANVFVRVLAVAGSLMFIGFAMSVVSSVVSRDHTIMAKAALHLPLAAIEMAALVTVTAALVSGSDEIANYIAGGASKGLTAFVTTTLVVAVASGGIIGMLLAGFIIVAGLMVWAVLIVRTALIYVAVMTGPLIFASAVHPATRHARKRYVEGGIALICSKIVMAIAFATGSAMLGGISASPSFATAVGALMQALAILVIAAFAPFIFIKLLIAAEALTIAEGIERRPLRAGMSGASGVYHGAGLKNMMGRMGNLGSGGASQGGGDDPDGGSGGGGKPSGPSSGGASGRKGQSNVARGIAAARRVASHMGSAGGTSSRGDANNAASPVPHANAGPADSSSRPGADGTRTTTGTSHPLDAPSPNAEGAGRGSEHEPTPSGWDDGQAPPHRATTANQSLPLGSSQPSGGLTPSPESEHPASEHTATKQAEQGQFALATPFPPGERRSSTTAGNGATHGVGSGPSTPASGSTTLGIPTTRSSSGTRHPAHPAPPRTPVSPPGDSTLDSDPHRSPVVDLATRRAA